MAISISSTDLELFEFADDPASALALLQRGIERAEREDPEAPTRVQHAEPATDEGAPDFAHANTPAD